MSSIKEILATLRAARKCRVLEISRVLEECITDGRAPSSRLRKHSMNRLDEIEEDIKELDNCIHYYRQRLKETARDRWAARVLSRSISKPVVTPRGRL